MFDFQVVRRLHGAARKRAGHSSVFNMRDSPREIGCVAHYDLTVQSTDRSSVLVHVFVDT